MRVIGGRYKGRRLFSSSGLDIRPTIARLKEAYFNIVRERIGGAAFLDLCSGSGSIAIEALSRGAAQVVCIEKSAKAISILKRNLDCCGIATGIKVIQGDLFREIPRLGAADESFDLIYFDPPYFEDLYTQALELISRHDILKEDGLCATNHFKKIKLPDQISTLHKVREAHHGDSFLSFYQLEE